MSILKYKYQAHKLINYIFYIVLFCVGFIFGYASKEINFNELISNVLFIDNVSAYTIYEDNDVTIDEEFILNEFLSVNNSFSFENYSNVLCQLNSTFALVCYFFDDYTVNNLIYDPNYTNTNYLFYYNFPNSINFYRFYYSIETSSKGYNFLSNSDMAGFSVAFTSTDTFTYYSNFLPNEPNRIIEYSDELNVLDFRETFVLDAQVNTWNGYGYDFYTNQVGILDMELNTHIVSSHSCPSDGEFVSGYFGDTNDICMWSYNSTLSDFLVFYFNGRIYDSQNVEWSNITFLQNHKYTLSFTLYGLVSTEQLYSIQFSLEGDLNQEILATDFKQVLYDSIDEKTYLTFTIIPTEDIEFDHFFLKYLSNGSYAQTIGANRLWVYNDYTNLTDEQISIIQTDKLLQSNKGLKDLINDPFTNKPSRENFWDNFNETDFGLSTIVLSPIRAVQKISNGVCTPQTITILNKNIVLPCGDTLFWNRGDVASFKIFWNMFWGGIICYHIGISIFKLIHDYNNPSSDKVEVLDL